MEEDRTYSVYCHTSPHGKKYVGISYNPEKRWKDGYGYKSNKHFWGAIQKYGWNNFKHEILMTGLLYKEAKQEEAKLIAKYDLLNQEKGYNHSPSGDNSDYTAETFRKQSKSKKNNKYNVGRTLSEETKEKISESLNKHYSVPGVTGPNYGRKFPEESRKKMKDAAKKRCANNREEMISRLPRLCGEDNPNSRPVIRIDDSGNKVLFISITDAKNKTGNEYYKNGITYCCQAKQETYKGFKWRYADETEEEWQNKRNKYLAEKQNNKKEPRRNPPKGKAHHASIPIKCIDYNQNEYEFDCIADGARFIEGSYSNNKHQISVCCKQNGGEYKGYFWYYDRKEANVA